MSAPTLSRRALLRGLGGAALALPMLECMPRAHAVAGGPGRLVVMFGGFSTSVDGHSGPNQVVPSTSSFTLTSATAPLLPVQSDISLVSGLSIPVAGADGLAPPGGRLGGVDSFHFHVNPLLAASSQVGDGFNTRVTSPSIDQLAAPHLGVGTRFASLTLRAQPVPYTSNTAEMITPSFRQTSDGVQPVQPSTNPRVLFRSLTSLLVPEDSLAAAERADALARRRSVLDLVDRRMSGLLPRMSRTDQTRLDQHFTLLRELEQRLDSSLVNEGGACVSGLEPVPPRISYDQRWSGEVERAQQMVALVRLAFACDLTRVVALMVTPFRSDLNLQHAFSRPHTLHFAHHNGTNNDTKDAIAWHMQAFADLVAGLQDDDGQGGRLLDNTAAVFMMEGGFSRHPTTNAGFDRTAHSTEHMAMLVAGQAGGLNPGRHIQIDGVHPGRVLLTAARAAGAPLTQFGDVSGEVSELF